MTPGARATRVACVQLAPPDAGTTVRARVDEVVARLEALRDVDLVVLPEMWPAGYFAFDDYGAVAEGVDGPVVSAIRDAARRLRAHVVGGSFVERHDGGELSNTTFAVDPAGDLLATYRKIHVFGYESRESTLIEPGREVVTVDTALGRLGLAVCYDLRFPELFRAMVDKGAELIVVPASWPAARLDHWRTLARARAIENQVVVVTCNAAGADRGTDLAGHSAILDPRGDVVAEAGSEPTVLRATVDLGEVERWRSVFPALEDRRIGRTGAEAHA
jgi:predicted amidohydrolase